jgi:histidinol dehydrogenase
MRILKTKGKRFSAALKDLYKRGQADTSGVEPQVASIIEDVKKRGDAALCEYTEKFDGVNIKGRLKVGTGEIKSAVKKVPKRDLELLNFAAERLVAFHRRQVQNSWFTVEKNGTTLGQKITPIERVGIYVPGGRAAYPSTVLMSAIPAKVAGVDEVIMVTPPSKRGINPHVLASAAVAGVDSIYRVGGAQAVAALAYGTETIPGVDKIVGPGNIYVATAKRLVFGTVGIDIVAGPSEILIINDGTGDPSCIAADLLSQAEHDELASSILVTTSSIMARTVKKEVAKQIKRLKRRKIADKAIARYGLIIVTRDLKEAVDVSNRISPEHLELFVERPAELVGSIRNAGAIFLGRDTPEALGDYLAGPNHTLPTGGTARFSSPLGVEDFTKRSSVIGFSREGLKALGPLTERFAKIEGLEAHARSVGVRLRGKKGV